MKRNGELFKKLLFLFLWVLCTAFSVMAAYWLAGAVPRIDDASGYFARLLNVLQNPLADYFNNYTPIAVILAFIVVELVFGIVLISKIIVNPAPVLIEDEAVNEWGSLKPEMMEEDRGEEEMEGSRTAAFIDQGDADSEEAREKGKKGKTATDKEEKEEKEVFLQEDMFLKLFNSGYTMPQINAMMELTTYIPSIDARQMMKMFQPSMDENEIRSYIESFFG